MAPFRTSTRQSARYCMLLATAGVLTGIVANSSLAPLGYAQPIPPSAAAFSAVAEHGTNYPNNGVGEGIGLPYTREQLDTERIAPPPRVKTQVTQPVNTQVQQAITPSQRVHTQVRLGFLDKLFSPEAVGDLPDNSMQHLSQLENHLYSKQYPDDDLGKRLHRVEKSLWPDGLPEQPNGLPMAEQHVKNRWLAIQTAMANKLIIATKEHQPTTRSTMLMTVGYMEQRLFPNGSPYGFENDSTHLDQRLSRLEMMLFGSAQPKNTVKARVNKLAEHFPISASGIQVETTQGSQPASRLKPTITPTIEAIQAEDQMPDASVVPATQPVPVYRLQSAASSRPSPIANQLYHQPVTPIPTAVKPSPTPVMAPSVRSTAAPSPMVEIRYTPAAPQQPANSKPFNQQLSVGQPWALAH